MRFITEFKLSDAEISHSRIPVIEYRKRQSYIKMGELIGEMFGWEEKGETTLNPSDPITERHRLEIEAFPMDKWVEFKKNLYELFHKNGLILSGGVLEHILKELESYGTKKEPL